MFAGQGGWMLRRQDTHNNKSRQENVCALIQFHLLIIILTQTECEFPLLNQQQPEQRRVVAKGDDDIIK